MKDNNKSLFLYTGLIFLVALLIILLSLFGQTKFKKPDTLPASAPSGWGISEKISVVVAENEELLKKNSDLKGQINDRDIKITELTEMTAAQTELLESYNIIMNCYELCKNEQYAAAKELLKSVNTQILSPQMRMLYDELVNKVN